MPEKIVTAADLAAVCHEPTPQECAAQVLRFLPAYERAIGAPEEDREETLGDLIADTLHLARQLGYDPAAVAAVALRNFHEEDEAPEVEPEEKPEPLLRVFYVCPINFCGHQWEEEYESACDSTCPKCGTENIEADRWEEA